MPGDQERSENRTANPSHFPNGLDGAPLMPGVKRTREENVLAACWPDANGRRLKRKKTVVLRADATFASSQPTLTLTQLPLVLSLAAPVASWRIFKLRSLHPPIRLVIKEEV